MDLKRVLSFPPYPGDYLHPVVYACTAVMLLCLLVSITTYIVHHSMIRINRNGWHTLLNFLFHIGLTFGVFAGGINLINQPFLCQIVGIVLHYASLSTMLWLTYIARNICNDVSKDPLQAQDEIEPAQTHTQPTVLRFYLVSDGIPLIIVAVTAAFSMENYGSRDDALYCWMAWEPSLGGFYLPMILLVLVMTMCFLVAIIKLKRHPERKYELRVLSEERQQLSSPESHHHCHTDKVGTSGPAGDGAPINTGASALANEHSFKSQLRATAFTLFLFLSTWALGALAVTLGHFLDMIFSCLYGAFCVTLGLFLLIQHCAKRDDVWHRWWVCCSSVTKTEDGNGEAKRQEVHQPHCNLNSSKQLLLSTNLMQSSFHRTTPPPQSPTTNHKGLCCVAVLSPIDPSTRSPLMEPMPSPCQQSLQDELSRVPFPLQRCPSDRSKSQPFTRPLPCLQDYCSHLTSTSMDGSMHSSHLDSPLAAHHCEGSPLVSNGSHFDLQLPCSSLHLDKQLVSCQALQRQTSCQSVQDSVLSCHANNMHNSITSFHSMLLPSHEFHTCQWPLCNSASHCSNTDYCEKSDLFTLQYQYQQGPDCHSSISKPTDKEKNHNTFELEQRGMPRNTLPRQHTMLNRRGPLGRNRSLQEDGLFGSDTTQNIRTGPWKNETTV